MCSRLLRLQLRLRLRQKLRLRLRLKLRRGCGGAAAGLTGELLSVGLLVIHTAEHLRVHAHACTRMVCAWRVLSTPAAGCLAPPECAHTARPLQGKLQATIPPPAHRQPTRTPPTGCPLHRPPRLRPSSAALAPLYTTIALSRPHARPSRCRLPLPPRASGVAYLARLLDVHLDLVGRVHHAVAAHHLRTRQRGVAGPALP